MYGFLICGKIVKLTYLEFNDVSSSLAESGRVAFFSTFFTFSLLYIRLSALLLSFVLFHFRQESLVFYFSFLLLQTAVPIFVAGLGCCCALRTV